MPEGHLDIIKQCPTDAEANAYSLAHLPSSLGARCRKRSAFCLFRRAQAEALRAAWSSASPLGLGAVGVMLVHAWNSNRLGTCHLAKRRQVSKISHMAIER